MHSCFCLVIDWLLEVIMCLINLRFYGYCVEYTFGNLPSIIFVRLQIACFHFKNKLCFKLVTAKFECFDIYFLDFNEKLIPRYSKM
jgi:hypothetical protein